MKKILLLFALTSAWICKAQPDDKLFDYTWQLSQINIDGQTDIPSNDELNSIAVTINFYDTTPYTFSLKVCKTLSGEIEYPSENIMVFPSEFSVSGDACTLPENNDFESLLFSFFQNNLNIALDYAIGIVKPGPPVYHPIIYAPNGDWVEFHEALLSTASFDQKMFAVYPNPASEVVNVKNLHSQNLTKMRLLSIQGAVIMETHQDFLNTQNLTKGIYILELLTEDGSKQIEKVLRK